MTATGTCRLQARHTHPGLSRLGWYGNCQPRIIYISGSRGNLDEQYGIEDTADDNFVGCGATTTTDGWRLALHQQVDLLSSELAGRLGLACGCWMMANLSEDQHDSSAEARKCLRCRPALAPGGRGEKEVLAAAAQLRPTLLVSADRDLFNPFRAGTGTLSHAWSYPDTGVGVWNGYPLFVPPYKLSARFSCPHARLDGQPRRWQDAWAMYAEKAGPQLSAILQRA